MEGRHEQRRRPFQQTPRLPYPLGITTPTTHTLAGQKRDNAGYIRGPTQGADLKQSENSKLFVTSIPKNIAEDEVRGVFAEHGNILELALIKDKRTGIQQGFCFVKYSTREEAERAIRALHNQRTLPGGTSTLQVRFADEDRERSSSVEHKLFVGSLDKQATEKEIELIFAPYGRVDDVYIIRDDQGQSKGCSFVRFATKEMGMAAIKGLNGVYKMPGCTQPMIVRFADPKRPRSADTRVGGPSFGGPGFSPRSGQGSAAGPTRVVTRSGGPDNSRFPPLGWRPSDNPSFGPPQPHPHSFSISRNPNETPEGIQGAAKGTAHNSQLGLHQQTNEQQKQFPTSLPPSQHLMHSTYQNPLQPPDMKTQSEAKSRQQLDLLGYLSPPQQHSFRHSSPFSMLPPPAKTTELPFQPTLLQQVSHLTQPQFPQSGHHFSPPSSSSLQLPVISHQPSNLPSHPLQQQHPPPHQVPLTSHNQLQAQGRIPPHQIVQNQSQFQPQGQIPPHQMLQQLQNMQPLQNMQQLQQLQQKLQQQLQEVQQQLQMPQQQQHQLQQPQTVQNQHHQFQSFQQQNQQLQQLLTSVQSASTQPQLQQQIPLHPPTVPELQHIQSLPSSQQMYFQAPQSLALQNSTSKTVIWANSVQPQVASSATTPVITVTTAANTTQPCSWTEHISPDGHKYYYNSLTGESRWEKPEELSKHEVQQQQQQQQLQLQPQQIVLPQFTGATLGIGYGQVQSGLTVDSLKPGLAVQQGVQSGQDWALNMKSTG